MNLVALQQVLEASVDFAMFFDSREPFNAFAFYRYTDVGPTSGSDTSVSRMVL